MSAPFWVRAELADARDWSRGRWWLGRALLLLVLAGDGYRHLRDPDAGGLFAGITFGIHELGHLVFALLGEFPGILGGSLNQLLIPVAAGALLRHHRDYFGVTVAGTWLSWSLVDLARYIGDARAGELDLLSFSENAVHDWAWLLGRFGLLAWDTRLAGLTRAAGVAVLLLSLAGGVWLCRQMAVSPGAAGDPS